MPTVLDGSIQKETCVLDPEYMHTSQLTVKSDVYSFGVVLIKLMTGKKALSIERPEEERSLVMYFFSRLKDNRLFEIVEEFIAEEGGNPEQLSEVTKLARRCLRVKWEERTSMKEVAKEFEGIRVTASHPWVTIDLNPEEMVSLLNEGAESITYTTDSRNAGYSDSTRNCDMHSVSARRL